LDEQFERVLLSLFSIPWLTLQAKGAIFVFDENMKELVLRCQQGLPPELVISCDRLPLGRCLCGRAASSRELLFADCVDARHETHYPGMLPHGHYCVPIVSGDRILGVLTLYLEEGHQTNPDEQAFLSTVADVLAALIVRERLERSLWERDMELRGAKKIQETLLPTSPPNVPGFDIAGRCFPAEAAAGDHFDYLWLPDGSLLVALADVAGHGFGPAIVAADFCARLRTLSETICDLREMAARLNAGLYNETAGEIFVTAILGRLDPTARNLTCLNAGHPEALVFNSTGEVRARYSSQSLPFAIKRETRFVADESVELADGELVLLYTDGLTEAHARNKSLFGIERAIQIVRENLDRTAFEIVEALYRAARQYAGAEKLKDDITVVIMKVFRAASDLAPKQEHRDGFDATPSEFGCSRE
jgi:serine phosphatase RsbU (regulator of sigma subunit)